MFDVPLSFGVPGGVWTAAVLFLGLGAVLLLGWRALEDAMAVRRRLALQTMRVLSAIALWLVAVQPQWVTSTQTIEDGELLVLLDSSRSLSLPADAPTRASRLGALVTRWARDAHAQASVFSFGERVALVDLGSLGERYPANGNRSLLWPALQELLLGEADASRYGGVVVVSDGAGEASQFEMDDAMDLGVKVHAVHVGERDMRDDAIVEVHADPVSFLRRPARVRLRLRSTGSRVRVIPVSLWRGSELEREVVAELNADGEAEIEIPFTPDRLGRAIYRLSIPVAANDAVPQNNSRAFLVRVVRDKLRILLVAGQPSWDQRFLRAFLKRDPATDLISFFILRNTSDLTMASPEDLALIPFPTDELFNEHLGSFDLVIFQNFEYGPYQMAGYLPRIRDYVLRGGSFAMIGGRLSFSGGAYADTPLEEILPVLLPPRSTPLWETLDEARFRPDVVRGLERHPLVRLRPDVTQTVLAWSRLAPVQGMNLVRGVREGALSLLERRTSEGQRTEVPPVLVVGQAGRGRTLALMTDGSWRWGMPTAGETGDASSYEIFWDRTIRWLSRDPTLERARITTDRERYGPGQRISLSGTLSDERYAPFADRRVTLRVVRAGETTDVVRVEARTDGAGLLETQLDAPARPGAYRAFVALEGDEASLAEEYFVVEAGGDELAEPRSRSAALRNLAEATGGSFFERPEDAPALDAFERTRIRRAGARVTRPFGSVWMFVLVMILVSTEWFWRRRWGKR